MSSLGNVSMKARYCRVLWTLEVLGPHGWIIHSGHHAKRLAVGALAEISTEEQRYISDVRIRKWSPA